MLLSAEDYRLINFLRLNGGGEKKVVHVENVDLIYSSVLKAKART